MKLKNWIYTQMCVAAEQNDKKRLTELWKMKEARPDLYPKLKEWSNGR
jgi:hypothetical protein